MTNEDLSVERIGNHLEGKSIALLITGGIAAYKIPSLARHFRQYGANVFAYMTPEAKEYVAERALAWACANPVVSDLSYQSEHLRESIGAYIVAPATYNSIGKFANGIADNAVTTAFASALGRLERKETSILIAPAMHGSMQNSIYRKNLETLAEKGVRIIEPEYRMGKANLPGSHYIVVQTIRELSASSLKGKKILVTAGPTPGRIDDVRFVTNKFRGRLGINIAEEAYMAGADVKLIIGAAGIKPPSYLDTMIIRDFDGYYSAVMSELNKNPASVGIFSAAVADYIPTEAKKGKIPSRGALKSIPLKETPKVIKEVRRMFPELFMVTFKYEEGISKSGLEDIAKERIRQGYQLVVANRGEDMVNEHNCMIVDSSGIIAEPSSKDQIARSILDIIGKKIQAA